MSLIIHHIDTITDKYARRFQERAVKEILESYLKDLDKKKLDDILSVDTPNVDPSVDCTLKELCRRSQDRIFHGLTYYTSAYVEPLTFRIDTDRDTQFSFRHICVFILGHQADFFKIDHQVVPSIINYIKEDTADERTDFNLIILSMWALCRYVKLSPFRKGEEDMTQFLKDYINKYGRSNYIARWMAHSLHQTINKYKPDLINNRQICDALASSLA